MRRTGGTNGARTFRGADSALVAPRSSWTALATLSPPARRRSPSALRPSDSAASLASTRFDLLKAAAMSTSHGRIRAVSLPCPTFIPVSTKVASILACAAMTASYVAWAVALWEGFYRALFSSPSSLLLSSPHAHRLTRSRSRARRAVRDQGRVGRHRVRPARPHGTLLGLHRLVRRHRRKFVPRRARRLDLATA